MPSSNKHSLSPVVSTISGAVAGVIETTTVWPMEFVKTHLQLQQRAKNPKYTGIVGCLTYTVRHDGVLGVYRGMLPVVLGSIPKTGIRFGIMKTIQGKIQERNSRLYGIDKAAPTAIQNMLTGMVAGVVEATIAVTPQETLKTKLIDSNASFVKGTMNIIRTEGFKGIYQGWGATVLKQSSNQGLRFMFFNLYKTQIFKRDAEAEKNGLSAVQALIGGMCSGCFSTICNNPFDMTKTRMQGLNASQYKNVFDCFVQVVRYEGVLALWQGVGTRLIRVVPGQGIVFMSFEKISQIVGKVIT